MTCMRMTALGDREGTDALTEARVMIHGALLDVDGWVTGKMMMHALQSAVECGIAASVVGVHPALTTNSKIKNHNPQR